MKYVTTIYPDTEHYLVNTALTLSVDLILMHADTNTKNLVGSFVFHEIVFLIHCLKVLVDILACNEI